MGRRLGSRGRSSTVIVAFSPSSPASCALRISSRPASPRRARVEHEIQDHEVELARGEVHGTGLRVEHQHHFHARRQEQAHRRLEVRERLIDRDPAAQRHAAPAPVDDRVRDAAREREQIEPRRRSDIGRSRDPLAARGDHVQQVAQLESDLRLDLRDRELWSRGSVSRARVPGCVFVRAHERLCLLVMRYVGNRSGTRHETP
jgi:hypothetical protein